MKTTDKQVYALLKAYDRVGVLAAIDLYKDEIENEGKEAKKQLLNDGWFPSKEKPIDREFYFIDDQYWSQSDSVIEKRKQELLKSKKIKRSQKKSKESMELKMVSILCPICKSKMYKQAVCGGCKEGKSGYKIRLICENDSDHEVLL